MSDPWLSAMDAHPRVSFLPDVIYRYDRDLGDNDLVPLSRVAHPGEWLAFALEARPVATQVDDGADGAGWEATSSASHPDIVANMLTELDPQPGERVLEIGTGTGWNAALLAHRIGAENVTTIEIDPKVASHARAALDRAGFDKVTTVVGDGELGWSEGAPYDRIIATVGSFITPYTWVEQLNPGGRLVLPLVNSYSSLGTVTLTKGNDGTASGRISEWTDFMHLRGQRVPRLRASEYSEEPDVTSTTRVHPYALAVDRDRVLAISQRVTGIHMVRGSGMDQVDLYHPETLSWAQVMTRPEPPFPVEQAGPRRLFDEVREGLRWWRDQGRPKVADWLVTVGPKGQKIELAN